MFVGQLVLSENSQQLQSVTFSACCNASAVCAALVGLSVHPFVCLFIYYVEACKHCCTIAYTHSRSLQQQMQPYVAAAMRPLAAITVHLVVVVAARLVVLTSVLLSWRLINVTC